MIPLIESEYASVCEGVAACGAIARLNPEPPGLGIGRAIEEQLHTGRRVTRRTRGENRLRIRRTGHRLHPTGPRETLPEIDDTGVRVASRGGNAQRCRAFHSARRVSRPSLQGHRMIAAGVISSRIVKSPLRKRAVPLGAEGLDFARVEHAIEQIEFVHLALESI